MYLFSEVLESSVNPSWQIQGNGRLEHYGPRKGNICGYITPASVAYIA